jgi:hypothetical protein
MTFRSPNSASQDRNRPYDRQRDLPRLLPLWPHELVSNSLVEHATLLARMRRALRLERQRGRGGHWAYDVARHADLLRAYRAETADYLVKAESARRLGRAEQRHIKG